MTAVHTVDVEIEDGVAIMFTFVCSGNDSSPCRMWCADGCEETCTERPVVGDPDLVAQAPVDGHRFVPLRPPTCRVADWLNACDGDDTYGADYVDEPHRAGRHAIVEEWDGDSYLWTYAEPDGATS